MQLQIFHYQVEAILKKLTFILLILSSTLVVSGQTKTLHDFKATTIDGETYDFANLKGKKVMIVNTASECALTPQFKKLQALYEEYGGDDFEIVGFPCNDFGRQDPGNNDEIKEFCATKYGVSFLMMEKVSIKKEPVHPVYQWLTSSEENGVLDAPVRWNFQKFLVDENGEVADFVHPIVGPQNKKIIEWLNQ